MQIVIDIPVSVYRQIRTNNYCSLYPIVDAIKNGTPLPEEHGRLRIMSERIIKKELTPLSFSCQNWISEVGLSTATVAIIEAEGEE